MINAMSNAKGIVRYGVGTDTIDLAAASANGIVVARVPNYGAEVEVAQSTAPHSRSFVEASLTLATHHRAFGRLLHQRVFFSALAHLLSAEVLQRTKCIQWDLHRNGLSLGILNGATQACWHKPPPAPNPQALGFLLWLCFGLVEPHN